MGFLDALLGRSKLPAANLDDLFALPSAAVTLEAATGLRPTGVGAVSFKAAEGPAFDALGDQINALLGADAGPKPEQVKDSYGFTWLVLRADAIDELVTDLHAVNSSLVDAGFGSTLLCTTVAFASPDGDRVGLVYLFKRGTFYPFAPQSGERRDSGLELRVRGALGTDLKIESDLSRWFPLWGAPGL